jgi:hypothetical protein
MTNLHETFYGGRANTEAINESKLERKNIELLLGRELMDYEWFTLECLDNRKNNISKESLENRLDNVRKIRGKCPNTLILDDFTITEK